MHSIKCLTFIPAHLFLVLFLYVCGLGCGASQKLCGVLIIPTCVWFGFCAILHKITKNIIPLRMGLDRVNVQRY